MGGAEALHFATVWIYLGGLSKADRGLPPAWYSVFLVLRVAGVLYLAWRGGGPPRSPAAPEPGSSGEDSDAVVDELAGDFTDAPDRRLARVGWAAPRQRRRLRRLRAGEPPLRPGGDRSASGATARGLSVAGDRI